VQTFDCPSMLEVFAVKCLATTFQSPSDNEGVVPWEPVFCGDRDGVMGKQVPHPRFARVRNDIDFAFSLVFSFLVDYENRRTV
jgi:hypothetical protein